MAPDRGLRHRDPASQAPSPEREDAFTLASIATLEFTDRDSGDAETVLAVEDARRALGVLQEAIAG